MSKNLPERQTDIEGIDFIRDIENGFNGYIDWSSRNGKYTYYYEAIHVNFASLQNYVGYEEVTTKVKNVIFMIGDGFGYNLMSAAEIWLKEHPGEEYMTFRDPENTGWHMNWQNVIVPGTQMLRTVQPQQQPWLCIHCQRETLVMADNIPIG